MNEAEKILTVRNDSLTLQLAPAAGGSIAAFYTERSGQRIDLMRRMSEQGLADNDSKEAGCFPLVPFSNRVANGRFRFHGRDVELLVNLPPHPHPLHGQGWRYAWRVASHSGNSAELIYDNAAGTDGWPWPYRARQHFTLDGNTLRVAIDITNTGHDSMPAGLGLHPYFPRTANAEMDVPVQHLWLGDSMAIPHTRVPVPPEKMLMARRVTGISLDDCYSGWPGEAAIRWPEHRLGLRMRHQGIFRHMVVYTPQHENFFCVEPVSNVNDFVNLIGRYSADDVGLAELQAGQSLGGSVDFSLEEL